MVRTVVVRLRAHHAGDQKLRLGYSTTYSQQTELSSQRCSGNDGGCSLFVFCPRLVVRCWQFTLTEHFSEHPHWSHAQSFRDINGPQGVVEIAGVLTERDGAAPTDVAARLPKDLLRCLVRGQRQPRRQRRCIPSCPRFLQIKVYLRTKRWIGLESFLQSGLGPGNVDVRRDPHCTTSDLLGDPRMCPEVRDFTVYVPVRVLTAEGERCVRPEHVASGRHPRQPCTHKQSFVRN